MTPRGNRIWLAALGAALTAGVLAGCGSSPAPAERPAAKAEEKPTGPATVKMEENTFKMADLSVEPVGYRALQPRLAVTGTVEPNLSGVMKVTPRVAGKAIQVRVNVGDNVRAGEVLAVLESTTLAEAQAELDHTGHQLNIATQNLARQRKLAQLGAFGAPKVEEARSRAVTVQGEIDTARSEVTASQNEVVEARSDLSARQGEVASAEADVSSAQADVSSAESAVAEAEGQVRAQQAAQAQAQTGVKVAQSRFNRADLLLKDQLVSRQDWEQAQADLQRAQSDVDAARAIVSQAQARVTQERAKVETFRAKLRAAQAKVQAARGRAQQGSAKIDTASARQAQTEAKLAAAQKRGQVAEQEVGREEKVFRGGYLTSKEVAVAEAARTEAIHEREAALTKVRLLGGQPGGGSRVTVTAPLGGRVTERFVTPGEMVAPEKPMFTVINLNTVWVQLSVFQGDLAGVRLGERVAVTSDTAPGRIFAGAVSYVGDVLDEKSRTVKVRCVIQNGHGLLKPASFVRGTIDATAGAPMVVAPADAVQEMDGKQVVFVPTGTSREFQVREVQIGRKQGGAVEIRNGLQGGERIVTKNAFVMKAQAMKSELSEE